MNQSLDILQGTEKHSPYECNICMETATNPVVTSCGHLYWYGGSYCSWTCIYQWLSSHQDFLSCPVCKNGIETSKLIPLYTRHTNEQDEAPLHGVPPRPRPKRNQQIPNPAAIGSGLPNTITNIGANLQRGVLLAGYGLFPPMGVLCFQQNSTIDDSGMDEPSPEMRYQTLFKSIRIVLLLLFIALIIVC